MEYVCQFLRLYHVAWSGTVRKFFNIFILVMYLTIGRNSGVSVRISEETGKGLTVLFSVTWLHATWLRSQLQHLIRITVLVQRKINMYVWPLIIFHYFSIAKIVLRSVLVLGIPQRMMVLPYRGFGATCRSNVRGSRKPVA